MKKILVLMLALVCVFTMFACGDDPVTPTPGGGDDGNTVTLNIDDFTAALNASTPKTAAIKVDMTNVLGTLSATYNVVYAEDGSAAINYTREEFNEIGEGTTEVKSTLTGTVAMSKDGVLSDTAALGGTGSLVNAKISLSLDKITATRDGNVLTATVSAANTASVLGVAIDADVTLILYIADGTVSSFSLNYAIGVNVYAVSCGYTY